MAAGLEARKAPANRTVNFNDAERLACKAVEAFVDVDSAAAHKGLPVKRNA